MNIHDNPYDNQYKRNRSRDPFPKLYLEYDIKDHYGRILRKGRRRRANSFVGNIIGLLSSISVTTGSTSVYYSLYPDEIRDINNASRNIGMASGISAAASAGGHTSGIRVGTGTAPVTIDQFNLASPIVHGTGTGQLLYADTLVEGIARSATTWLFRVIRPFSNSSGATVTINEVGLFFVNVMLARDLTGGIPVPNGATITFRYIISLSI